MPFFYMFENPRRGMQARNFTTNVPKILDLKSSSEQIFFRKLSLGAPEDDRKKRLAIEPFPTHPPIFGTVSRNHYSHSKILTPLSHCLKLAILEKRLIYDFFLVFHIVYILTFYC